MKTFDNLTVRELLHIEDGYYKLENPITYSIGGDKTMKYMSAEPSLTYNTEYGSANFNGGASGLIMPTAGDLYNVKLVFPSGITVEREIECSEEGQESRYAGGRTFQFGSDMFVDVSDGSITLGNNNATLGDYFIGYFRFTTSAEEAKDKYGDTFSITITGKGKPVTGEISGVISIDTKTNSTDGILKVITTMGDDASYYVDNIWQDGDALIIAEKDKGSGSGGGEGGGGDKLSDIVFKCDSQTLGTATCNYEVSSVWDMSADVLPVFKLVLLASDDHLNTTLYGTSVSHDVGLGGYTIGVNFILDSRVSYRVVGRGNGGTWTVSKQS